MSLIEEALKKQQEEFGTSSKGPTPPAEKPTPTLKKAEPPPPDPEPPLPPPLPPSPDKPASSKTLLPIIILVSVCVILLAVTFWLISTGFLKMFMSPKNSPAPQSVVTTLTQPPKSAEPPAEPLQRQPPPLPPTVPHPQAVEVTPPAIAPPPTSPSPSSAVITAPLPVHPTQSVVALPPAAKKTVVIVDEEAQPTDRSSSVKIKKITVWPEMIITGVIGADGANGAALINGQLISVGESYQGIRIISISRNSIRASFEGEIRTFKVGGK